MKILKTGGVLLLAAATVFFGFHFFFGQRESNPTPPENGDPPEVEALAYYRTRAEELETELLRLKEEQYTATLSYEARITELEALLSENQPPEAPTPTATYTYTVSGDQITITGYSGEQSRIVIPSSIDGLTVTAIGREAFRDSALTEVTVPETVKTIDWFAFYGCEALVRVTLPASVSKIEYGVFDGCHGLTVHCVRNSYADKYARSYGMNVVN